MTVMIFIVSPCILKIHQLLKPNKWTTMHCVYSKARIKTLKKLLHNFSKELCVLPDD
jgi:hypothetical protein